MEITVLKGRGGETLEYVTDAEAPTLTETRRLWRMVAKGDDEGVDPQYDGPPINWDEDTNWSDDEDVGPLGQTEVDDGFGPVIESQQHAQEDASAEKVKNLQAIAAQAFIVLGENHLGPFHEARQEAELDPCGEMRGVSKTVVDESSQSPDEYHATLNVPASFESSRESTKRFGKKRAWASLCGDGDAASDEGSDDEGNRGPKCLRTWQAEEADTLGEVYDIIGDDFWRRFQD